MAEILLYLPLTFIISLFVQEYMPCESTEFVSVLVKYYVNFIFLFTWQHAILQ